MKITTIATMSKQHNFTVLLQMFAAWSSQNLLPIAMHLTNIVLLCRLQLGLSTTSVAGRKPVEMSKLCTLLMGN